MTTIVEAASPQLEHWTFPSTMATTNASRSSTSSTSRRDSEKVPVGLKQELGFGMKRDSESILHHQYLSDEEGLSPTEHGDTLSVEEDSDDFDDIEFDENLLELATTYEYTAKACTEALVISMKPVRPTMVEVSLHSSTEKSSRSDSPSKPSSRHDSPMELSSDFEKVARRSMSSTYSQSKRFSSIPLMESAAEARAVSAVFLPPSGPSPHPSFLDSDPFSTTSLPQRPSSTSHSRLRSLSKTISIAKFATRKSNDGVKSPTTPSKPKDGASRLKLVPRGANEREPVLQLPEFPDKSDDQIPSTSLERSATPGQWPDRSDSRPSKPKLRKRKSLVFG
ncbi:hypothetical protein EV356DRAFT_236106 [Viridothelium virens]|uniref:Uncharacterized protein n=1 Tax=Viridothelium virens TaxID=1048519 RepID=A0A6A6H4J2_VIRVR|nr:hypothetical protein EV356DRAFT_236106 [Viridothelium virens]